MKHVKALSLSALVLAALTAFVAAGTGSATVLCKNNSSTSSCSEKYWAGTEIHAVSEGTVKLTTSFKNIECEKATVVTRTSNEGSSSSTVSGNGETVLFENCNCEVALLKTGSFEIHSISGTDNGTITSSGAEGTTSCSTIFGNVHCIYATNNTDLGTLTGGNPAKADVSSADIPRLSTNGLCDESMNVDATLSVTTPQPLYVAAG